MYWEHPARPEAYTQRNEYLFGTNLLVAPITAPADRRTGLGETTAWLPPGDWFDMLTGLAYRGDRTIVLHRDLDTIPVLARAGSVLPLVPASGVEFGTANPDALQIRVYAGGDATFTLAEDRDDERWAETQYAYADGQFSIAPATGELASIPSARSYELVLCGFAEITSVTVGGRDLDLSAGPVPGSVAVSLGAVATPDGLTARIAGDLRAGGNADVRERIFTLLDDAQIEYAIKEQVWTAADRPIATAIAELTAMNLPGNLFSAIVELITAHPTTDVPDH